MQDGGLLQYARVRAGRSLIGPLAREGESAGLFVKKGEDLAASHSAQLEDQEAFSRQGVERVGYRRPSPIPLGVECGLLGVSRRFVIG